LPTGKTFFTQTTPNMTNGVMKLLAQQEQSVLQLVPVISPLTIMQELPNKSQTQSKDSSMLITVLSHALMEMFLLVLFIQPKPQPMKLMPVLSCH
jgi:hypothetical protein